VSSGKQAKNEGIKKLTIQLKGVTNTRIAVLLTPLALQTAEPLPAIKLAPLNDW
jgi:hypothetical protein